MDLASRAAGLSFLSNFTLMFVKLAVGLSTGSIAILSDALDSAEDTVSSSFAFFSIRVSARPADVDHPYGHGKVESLAAATQALLIGGGGVFIMYQAVHRLIDGQKDIVVGPGLATMGATALVNLGVALYVGRAARASGSLALASETRHLRTNIAQAVAVTFGLALVGLTGRNLFDPLVALFLAVYILWTAARIFQSALVQIMDVSLPPSELDIIEHCVLHVDSEITGYHDLRTRRSGRERYIDLHLVVDPRKSVGAVHNLCDRIEGEIVRHLPGSVVTIHVEPADDRSPTPDGAYREAEGSARQPAPETGPLSADDGQAGRPGDSADRK
jgi:cation diffusion facilitator family transporter